MSVPVYEDPCALCTYLRAKLTLLLAGEMVSEIEFNVGTGSSRRVKKIPPNLDALKHAIADADGRCNAVTPGARPRRFAAVGGFRTRPGWWW